MKVVAIIPARGGSKRLKNKNIYPIWGKPMLYWAIKACKDSVYNIEPIVSTDSEEIADIARLCGARVHMRKGELCKDDVYKQVAIRSAASDYLQELGFEPEPEVFISLQANSPQIKAHHLDSAIDVLINNNKDEIFSVDSDLMQNAAFRVFKGLYVFQKDLSTNCGVFVCDLHDVHTKEDVEKIEGSTPKKASGKLALNYW